MLQVGVTVFYDSDEERVQQEAPVMMPTLTAISANGFTNPLCQSGCRLRVHSTAGTLLVDSGTQNISQSSQLRQLPTRPTLNPRHEFRQVTSLSGRDSKLVTLSRSPDQRDCIQRLVCGCSFSVGESECRLERCTGRRTFAKYGRMVDVWAQRKVNKCGCPN